MKQREYDHHHRAGTYEEQSRRSNDILPLTSGFKEHQQKRGYEKPIKEILLFASLLPICQNHVGGDETELQQLYSRDQHQQQQHHLTLPFFLIELRANRLKFEEDMNQRFLISSSSSSCSSSYEVQQKKRTVFVKWVLQHKKNRGIAKFLISSVQGRDEYTQLRYHQSELYEYNQDELNQERDELQPQQTEQEQNDLLMTALVNDNDSDYRQYDGDLDLTKVAEDVWYRTAARVRWELLFCLMRNVFCHESHFEWSWLKALAIETEKLFGSLEFLVDALFLYETIVIKPIQEASNNSMPDKYIPLLFTIQIAIVRCICGSLTINHHHHKSNQLPSITANHNHISHFIQQSISNALSNQIKLNSISSCLNKQESSTLTTTPLRHSVSRESVTMWVDTTVRL